MPNTSPSRRRQNTEVDPGVTNEPRTSVGSFDAHVFSQINQVYEKLGGIDQKLTQALEEQKEQKASIEKLEKVINRAVWTLGGIVAALGFLWFVYDNILKDNVKFSPPQSTVEQSVAPTATGKPTKQG